MELENPLASDSTESETETRVEGEDYINWNGEEIEDFIEVEDKSGDIHRYPEIAERSEEGEFYRFCNQVNYYFGGEIGSHDEVTSTKFPESHDQFPNRYIGQTEGSSIVSIEDAISPKAAIYRQFGAKNGWDGADGPWQKARDAFHEVCEYGIEVYKANFPEAESWSDKFDMERVMEHNSREWEDLWLPSNLVDMFDGMPPMIQELEEEEDSEPETEEESESSDTLTIPDNGSYTEKIKAVLDQEPDLFSEKEWLMDNIGCSESVYYSARKEWKQENTETDSEEETENDEKQADDSEESREELEERVENLEEKVEMMKEVQKNTQASLEMLAEVEEL